MLADVANKLSNQTEDLDELLWLIKRDISEHARSIGGPFPTKDIFESRFTPAQEAYDRGLMSCGTIATISAEMLRHVGYKIKLVHGSKDGNPLHAWISVFDQTKNKFVQYDLSQKDIYLTDDYKVIQICDDWSEVEDLKNNSKES